MRIKTKLSQSRRDFSAIYECEHCKETAQGEGYDDHNFHTYVIPHLMRCKACKRTSEGVVYTYPSVPAHITL